MYPAKPGLIIGFHGCDVSVRNRLANGEITLRPSNNDYDWLGGGIYFWENNQQRALDFANELKYRKNGISSIETPAVIGAVLDIGYCLDLLDASYIERVKDSYEMLLASCNILNIPIPVNSNTGKSTDLLLRYLDCAVIQNLHFEFQIKNEKPFDSVRGAFIEGTPLYANAGFHDKNHIQLCIRNPNCIKGYFIPRIAANDWSIP